MIIKNICLLFIIQSLIFILAQQELIYIIFSLVLFIISSLSQLTYYQVEFLILILFIIYVGVIVVLFLFTVIIYNLPKLELTVDALGICITLIGLFLMLYDSPENAVQLEYIIVDLVQFIPFINEYFTSIILCGLLLIISIITALLIINTLEIRDY